MSLAIDVDTITQVLIAGTWYKIKDKSFALDSYEFIWWSGPRTNRNGGDNHPELLHGGGNDGICATGFTFKTTEGDLMSGPLDRITAVRHTE